MRIPNSFLLLALKWFPRRWKNQAIHHAWKDWYQFKQDASWYHSKGRIIGAKRRIFELQDATVDWKDITDERLYNRSLVGDAILMWSNREVVWAFRSMDEHAQQEIWMREVIKRFRTRFELRPAQRMLIIWSEWTDQQVRHLTTLRRKYQSFVWHMTYSRRHTQHVVFALRACDQKFPPH